MRNISVFKFIVTVSDIFMCKRSFNIKARSDRYIGAWLLAVTQAKDLLEKDETIDKIELIEVE